VRLFNRTTRSVSLSDAGESFLARVRPALRDIAAAMEAVNEFRDTPSGTLRLNTSTGAAQGILAPLVLEFLRRYPDMQVEVTTEDRLVDIVAEGYDAGIRLSEAVPRDMIAVPCGPELSIAVVGAPAYFKRHPKPTAPADLLSHNCIRMRFKRSAILRWQFEKHGEELVIDVKGSLTLDDSRLILDAVRHGHGLAYTADWAVAADVAAGRLIRVLEDWTPPFPGLAVFYLRHRHVPAGLRAFIDLVRDASKRGLRPS
jgi:DNA-binding transcriptional LysR family regulator